MPFNFLRKISQIDSDHLDKLYLADIYGRHLDMKKTISSTQHHGHQPFRSAIVVGAGPIGLFTALQLFTIGIETTVVCVVKKERFYSKIHI
jgi:threonine dehydrogenase-like Zn-dependent dehydrogenase